MADKTFHSIKFPGLPDTYKIPDIVNEYSTSSAYAVGDYVLKDGKTYKCTTAIASSGETWNSAHWTEVKVGNDLQGEVADLKSALGLSGEEILYSSIPNINTVLFTTSDVSFGDEISYDMTLPNIGASGGQYTGYIGLYDSQETRSAYYGRGSSSDPTTHFNGTFTIPAEFSVAKWYGAINPTSLRISKIAGSTSGTVPFVRYDQSQSLTDEQKITAQTNIGVESVPDMYDFLGDVLQKNNGEINISDYPQYTGWLLNGDKWAVTNADAPSSKHVVIPVEVGEEILISTNSDRGVYIAFFTSYTQPTQENEAANVVSGHGRIYIQPSTEETVTVPQGTQYLYFGITPGTGTPYSCEKLVIPSQATNIPFTEIINDAVDNAIRGNGVKSITFGASFEILSNEDQDATEYDDGWITAFNIIQISDSMYYMYYGGEASEDMGTNGYHEHLLFAYSTDGIHYTRGFPPGVTPPYPGTNKYFDDRNSISPQSVFKCCDPVYPFRLICQEIENGTNHVINMYKSTDGINFDASTKKKLRYELHDTQTAVICRGDILKMYFREREERTSNNVSYLNRRLGVMFYDLEGNVLSPSKKLDLNYIYNSGATAINDREELIFPTHFNNDPVNGVRDQSISLTTYLVNKYSLKEIPSNIDSIITSDDKFMLIQPGFITINGEQYICIRTQNANHDEILSTPNRKSTYKLAKITMNF